MVNKMFEKEFKEALKALKKLVPGYENIQYSIPFPHVAVIELNGVSAGRLMNKVWTMIDRSLADSFSWTSQNGYLIITETIE